MLPERYFLGMPSSFFANVRFIGQEVGYTDKRTHLIRKPTLLEIQNAYRRNNIMANHFFSDRETFMKLGKLLIDYFEFRALTLEEYVEPRLMNVDRARNQFQKLKQKLSPNCPISMNKQRGEKRAPAYFTSIINMIIEANTAGIICDYDPRRLATIT